MGEDLRRVALLAGEEVGLVAGDGDGAAEAGETLRQLAAERAAAEHQQPPRASREVEDRLVGQVAGGLDALDVRPRRSRTGGDEGFLEGECGVAHRHPAAVDEGGGAEEHVDAEAAKNSLLGGLCASGWQTAAVFMKLNVAYTRRLAEDFVAAGYPAPRTGPSPGIKELRWPRPVFASDTVSYTLTITGKRASASRPGWGLIEARTLGTNQHGEPVISFLSSWFAATN